jgi:hypothetical protein
MNDATERSDGSHANGAGPGAPASERAGGFRGAKPPGQTWKIAAGGPERGALPRRACAVTPRGMAAVRASQRTLQHMWSGLERILR